MLGCRSGWEIANLNWQHPERVYAGEFYDSNDERQYQVELREDPIDSRAMGLTRRLWLIASVP